LKSKIGYLISGPVTGAREKQNRELPTSMFNILISHKIDERNIDNFWNLESIGINSKDADETDSNDYLTSYQETSIVFIGNNYIARLPWKQDMTNYLQMS